MHVMGLEVIVAVWLSSIAFTTVLHAVAAENCFRIRNRADVETGAATIMLLRGKYASSSPYDTRSCVILHRYDAKLHSACRIVAWMMAAREDTNDDQVDETTFSTLPARQTP